MTDDSPDAGSAADESGRPGTADGTADAADVDLAAFYESLEHHGRPVVTAAEAARDLDCSQAAADDALDALAERGQLERLDVSDDPVVWFPTDWRALADRERVVVFPERREIVADGATQFTRARLSTFARLLDVSGTGAARYEIRPEDVWGAPHDTLDALLDTVRAVLPALDDGLREWIEDQWRRAHLFTLRTHPDGYTVLSAASESLMGNVARQKLDDTHLRAAVSDTESWVNEQATAAIKRVLYEAGYPVQDERDLESGDALDVSLELELRAYQRDWVDRFRETGAGVLVGPPGSGKTVAAMAVLADVGGETLILVPGRDLARQWREQLLAHTSLAPDQVGLYHGGEKRVRPVTVATYQTAGMDRHRQLFDDRRWGLIVYDEVHHIPTQVYRRSADLQTRHRLGLSATPVREDDDEEEIFTLVGPPIGTDWDALFDAGFVAQPEVELRYVPWADELAHNEFVGSEGHDRRELAACNPAKIAEARRLLARHADKQALVFVEYLDQGRALSEALDVPFISGETPYGERERLLREFDQGRRDALVVSRVADEGLDLPSAELAVAASGLGGSRRQGSQRAGRTMRPAGSALVYVLATRGTREEEFARRQLEHLASKGVRVRERAADEDGSLHADAPAE